MGLDTTHGCWHGAYSAFNRWRTELMRAAGLPPLELMEGFYGGIGDPIGLAKQTANSTALYFLEQLEKSLPLKWEALKPDPIHELLNHSDCDGEIPWESCAAIADSLEAIAPNLPEGDFPGHIGNWQAKTEKFIKGLRDAAAKKENVGFH